MKCAWADCRDDAVRHIVEIKDRKIVSQKGFCDVHCARQKPFCEPGGGITSLGAGLTGSINRFELDYITFFDNFPADAVRLREISGSKRFAIPVARYETYGIVRALQERTYKPSRPFTFAAFALIINILGGKLEEVVLDEIDVQGEFYHTKVRLRQANQLVVGDIRPSDAFALAVACDAPILIADRVLEQSAKLGWTQQPAV